MSNWRWMHTKTPVRTRQVVGYLAAVAVFGVLIFLMGCSNNKTGEGASCPIPATASEYNEGRTDVLDDFATNLLLRIKSWRRQLGDPKQVCFNIPWVKKAYNENYHTMKYFNHYVAPQDVATDKLYLEAATQMLIVGNGLIEPLLEACKEKK